MCYISVFYLKKNSRNTTIKSVFFGGVDSQMRAFAIPSARDYYDHALCRGGRYESAVAVAIISIFFDLWNMD